jgi:hypothetical protein
VNGVANAEIGGASADLPSHRVIDLGAARMRTLSKNSCSGHDLPRLAVSILSNLFANPRFLDWMEAICAETLNREDTFPAQLAMGV